jgi:hypothetical protein
MLSEHCDEVAATVFFKQAIDPNGFPNKVVMDKSVANYAWLRSPILGEHCLTPRYIFVGPVICFLAGSIAIFCKVGSSFFRVVSQMFI